MALSDAERKSAQREREEIAAARQAGLDGLPAPTKGPPLGRNDYVMAWAEGVWERQAAQAEAARLTAKGRMSSLLDDARLAELLGG